MKEAFEKPKKWFGELQKKAEDDEEVILHYEGHSLSYEFLDGRKDAFKEAQKIVSEVEAEYINKSTEHINKLRDCSTNWIPCSERLPEKCGAYLVSYKNTNCIPCATVFDGVQFLDKHVIAWMPLPEPYKPEKGAQHD